jgi:hypothetical protein
MLKVVGGRAIYFRSAHHRTSSLIREAAGRELAGILFRNAISRAIVRERNCSCNGTTVLPKALLVDFAPLDGAWCCFGLNGG